MQRSKLPYLLNKAHSTPSLPPPPQRNVGTNWLTDSAAKASNVAYLMEELFHSAITEAESLEPQINKLLQAARDLDSLGFGLADKVLAFVIVMALPESLSILKTILYNTRGTDLTSDGIVHQILIDEQRRIRASGLAATAYYAKASKAGKSKTKPDKHCSHCNVSECRKLKKTTGVKNHSRAQETQGPPQYLCQPRHYRS